MAAAAFVVVLGPMQRSLSAQQSHTITVQTEESIYSELRALVAWIIVRPQGADVPEELSIAGAAAMANVIATASRRVDEEGWLTLDDGAKVRLRPGDVLRVHWLRDGEPEQWRADAQVVMERGRGFAVVLGRVDLCVPSTL